MAADSTTSVDSMLADAISKMDALNKRMDALEVGPGSKHPIKGDDDDDKKDDAARSKSDDDDDDDDKADSVKKGDAITAPKTKILSDAKAASKDDGAEPPSKVKGDDGELEIKHGGEKKKADKKADASFPPAKKAAKDDDDDDKKRDDDDDDDDKKDDAASTAKADDIGELRRQIADQRSIINRLEALVKPRSDEEHAAFADAQARADAVYAGFGQRAPRPLEGEALFDYRRRLATKLKSHSPMWKGVKFSKLDEETFGPIEAQVYADATSAAANPVDLEAGELRAVTKTDPSTGLRTIVFYGKESFVKGMGRPGRRVASFRTMQSV